MPCLVAVVDRICPLVGQLQPLFKILVMVAQDHSSQTAIDLVTVTKEWKIHKHNSRVERSLPNSDKYRQHNRHGAYLVLMTPLLI